jgi:RNA polymerase sigma-70 factor (ECF subfamily)
MKDTNAQFSIIAEYYSLHYEELKAFVAKRMLYSESSEDIVQNVFLKLMSNGNIVTPVTLPCLVYTMAQNLINDYWRHRKYIDEYEHYVKFSSGMFAGADHDTPASVYSVNEINEMLEHSITTLSEHQQKIYRLNIYDGMKVSEISKTLDMNYKSVEHRLGSARKEVREYIRKALA